MLASGTLSNREIRMSSDTDDKSARKNAKHKASMEKQKANVDASIEAADTERGVSILLTGDGKGKSTSAFGMVMRALGYGHKVGVIQFIKGVQLSGEEIYLRDQCPQVDFYQMGTGFTWDTQDRSGDIAAAIATWAVAKPMLEDPNYNLVVLDELTYMLAYDYLPEAEVVAALQNRPKEQSVVVTGRGGGTALQEVMDTVSEVKEIKHAFTAGIKARLGVDF
jgi:cob(I)alamin adenosyltransferase